MLMLNYACDCIKPILEKAIEVNELENVEEIGIEPASFFDGGTSSFLVWKIEGKRPRRVYILHKYCPFCGKEIIKKESK